MRSLKILLYTLGIIFSFLMIPAKSYALSCALAHLSQQDLDNAHIAFLGRVTEILEEKSPAGDSHGLERMQAYRYEVLEPIKNTTFSNTHIIYRNVYWGDISRIGYLDLIVVPDQSELFPEMKQPEDIVTPFCKHTLFHTLDNNARKVIEAYTGRSIKKHFFQR